MRDGRSTCKQPRRGVGCRRRRGRPCRQPGPPPACDQGHPGNHGLLSIQPTRCLQSGPAAVVLARSARAAGKCKHPGTGCVCCRCYYSLPSDCMHHSTPALLLCLRPAAGHSRPSSAGGAVPAVCRRCASCAAAAHDVPFVPAGVCGAAPRLAAALPLPGAASVWSARQEQPDEGGQAKLSVQL